MSVFVNAFGERISHDEAERIERLVDAACDHRDPETQAQAQRQLELEDEFDQLTVKGA